MKTFEESSHMNINNTNNNLPLSKFLILLIFTGLIGGLIGFGAAKLLPSDKSKSLTAGSITNTKVEKTVGLADKKTYKDQAEGTLREGGIDGEGNFHLERQGGTSQNVYLTSTTVDMTPYIGKKIRVWGQTFTAEKAGWLMDVGLVEILQ